MQLSTISQFRWSDEVSKCARDSTSKHCFICQIAFWFLTAACGWINGVCKRSDVANDRTTLKKQQKKQIGSTNRTRRQFFFLQGSVSHRLLLKTMLFRQTKIILEFAIMIFGTTRTILKYALNSGVLGLGFHSHKSTILGEALKNGGATATGWNFDWDG